MSGQGLTGEVGRCWGGGGAREQLLAGAPLVERRLELAGVATAVLEGGEGPPVVLLHGQGAWAGMWLPVIPGLVSNHHLVVPDLPGLGESSLGGRPAGADLVLAWLGELIGHTCRTPPALVGISLGGSIAARFAAQSSERLASLVLVDAGGLAGRVRPRPGVVLSLIRQSLRPSRRNTTRLLRRLTIDLERVRKQMGPRWEPFLAYLVDRASTPSVRQANRQLLRQLGLPGIPGDQLARVRVPTTLIWGRHDPVVPLSVAEKASAHYGWRLNVIDHAAHLCLLEQPQAVLQALRASIEGGAE